MAVQSRAVISTAHASKYLQQLCKHFAHKVEVDFTSHKGDVDFLFGTCRMVAEEGILNITCWAEGAAQLERAQAVIDSHIVKFAWREELTINWQDC